MWSGDTVGASPARHTLLIILFGSILSGCGGPHLWHPNAFETGKVMDQGSVEWEVHSPSILPMNGGFALAPLNGLETRITGGVVGEMAGRPGGHPIFGGEISVTKRVVATEHGFASASLGFERCGGSGFCGSRTSVRWVVGVYPSKVVGVYLSFKGVWLDAHWGLEESAEGFDFIPGAGVSFEGSHLAFRIAGNHPLHFETDGVTHLPYIGFQLSLRLPARKSGN